MLIGLLLLACLLSVPLAGGRLGALADLRLRAPSLAFIALALQVVIVTLVPGGAPWIHRLAHLTSYALLAAFLIANRRVPYLWFAGLGGALNVLAIVANGGVMPASARALAAAGIRLDPSEFLNSTALRHPHLLALGDVFAVPTWLPVQNVFSLGDVLIVVAAFLALHRICGSRLPGRRVAPAEVG